MAQAQPATGSPRIAVLRMFAWISAPGVGQPVPAEGSRGWSACDVPWSVVALMSRRGDDLVLGSGGRCVSACSL
jgi:hypothetical protein